jgi:periplasmic protein TonB
MGVYVHESNWASKRGLVFIGVIGIHVILVWGLASGFAMKIVEAVAPPIATEFLEEKMEEEAPPPPPPPKMELPPIEVPPPVVDITIPVESTATAITNVTDKPAPPAPPPVVVAAPVARVAPKLNPRSQQPETDEYYPPSSKRLGEQGNVVVNACIGENGRLTDVTVQTPSNIARLDEAALKYARALRYVAGTENGKPVASCFPFRVRFQLKD